MVKVRPIDSKYQLIVAITVCVVTFTGVMINFLYTNHQNVKSRRYNGRKDAMSVINEAVLGASKAETGEEKTAFEMQIYYGLADLDRTQDALSLYDQWTKPLKRLVKLIIRQKKYLCATALYRENLSVAVLARNAGCCDDNEEGGQSPQSGQSSQSRSQSGQSSQSGSQSGQSSQNSQSVEKEEETGSPFKAKDIVKSFFKELSKKNLKLQTKTLRNYLFQEFHIRFSVANENEEAWRFANPQVPQVELDQ